MASQKGESRGGTGGNQALVASSPLGKERGGAAGAFPGWELGW